MRDKDYMHWQRSNDKKGKILHRNYTHLHSRVTRIFERHVRTLMFTLLWITLKRSMKKNYVNRVGKKDKLLQLNLNKFEIIFVSIIFLSIPG